MCAVLQLVFAPLNPLYHSFLLALSKGVGMCANYAKSFPSQVAHKAGAYLRPVFVVLSG